MSFADPRRLSLLALLLFLVSGCKPARNSEIQLPELPASCGQVLLVTSAGWNAASGSLRRLERDEQGKWRTAGREIPVSLGRSGMGWGRGLSLVAADLAGPRKQEGDGRSPAGIFSLGTAFGYAAASPGKSAYPYRQATDRDYYVDDSDSSDYNRWVELPVNSPPPDQLWKSFERMRRDDDLYEFGLVVEHNMNPIEPNGGSAIFLHVWAGPGKPTAGCTAMARDDLVPLLSWLDPQKQPLLVQTPSNLLNTLTINTK